MLQLNFNNVSFKRADLCVTQWGGRGLPGRQHQWHLPPPEIPNWAPLHQVGETFQLFVIWKFKKLHVRIQKSSRVSANGLSKLSSFLDRDPYPPRFVIRADSSSSSSWDQSDSSSHTFNLSYYVSETNCVCRTSALMKTFWCGSLVCADSEPGPVLGAGRPVQGRYLGCDHERKPAAEHYRRQHRTGDAGNLHAVIISVHRPLQKQMARLNEPSPYFQVLP